MRAACVLPARADCEHEVQEVTSGHRLALVYSLLHASVIAAERLLLAGLSLLLLCCRCRFAADADAARCGSFAPALQPL